MLQGAVVSDRELSRLQREGLWLVMEATKEYSITITRIAQPTRPSNAKQGRMGTQRLRQLVNLIAPKPKTHAQHLWKDGRPVVDESEDLQIHAAISQGVMCAQPSWPLQLGEKIQQGAKSLCLPK